MHVDVPAAALLDFFGQGAHGFLSDFHTLAAGNRRSSGVNRGKNFRPAAFADKILLPRSEVYLHAANDNG